MMNQHIAGGSASSVTGGHHDYVSSGPPVASSHYLNGTSVQVARGGSNVHSRSSMPAYRNGLSYSSTGREAFSLDVHSYAGSPDSRYVGSSAGGLHNNYRNVRSSLALERVQPISGLVDTHRRIGTEVCSITFVFYSFHVNIKELLLFDFLFCGLS